MIFSSTIFLFLFLPAFLSVYYLTPARFRSLVILIGSYTFYAWWRVDFLLLFFLVTAWNFIIGRLIADQLRHERQRVYLGVGIAGDLLTLGYFKYANFGVDSLNLLLVHAGLQPFTIGKVILPIGISFYIFQAISYLIDVQRGDAAPSRSFTDFAAFIALFPQLIAGPILRYKDVADQFAGRTHTSTKFAEGCFRFMQGFIKKVFIADTLAPVADFVFQLHSPSLADSWLGAITYSLQLYYDFSGYSDMAIGLGLMMGFTFPENFNRPYLSQSITEFWRRWHISLSSWLKDYLYIPLGGNRKGKRATYRNLFLTMLLGGLWHGANWTFVIWGGWHGFWLAAEKAVGMRVKASFHLVNWFCCMIVVIIGWVMFRAENIQQAFSMYRGMFGGTTVPLSYELILHTNTLQLLVAVIAAVVIVLQAIDLRPKDAFMPRGLSKESSLILLALQVPLFLLSVSKLIASNYSPFLYFQF